MPHPSTDNLTIYTCGGLEIRLNGAPITGLASRKAEALLVYLACEPRLHRRDVLADMLWDDATIDRARGNLSVLLTSLRQQLGAYLAINRQTVGLAPSMPFMLDVAQITAAIDAAEGRALSREHAAELATALARYRGDFLQGFALRDSSGFEAWVLTTQEQVRRRVVAAYAQLTEAAIAHNDPASGIVHANALLALEPFHEATHGRLLLLLAQSGQRAAALNHYENYCRLLDEQLGVAPSLEVTDLYRRIWRGDLTPAAALPPPLAPERPSGLRGTPFTPTSFVGREAELAQITARLASPDCRLLTLVGPGGIGKSRLGLATAQAFASRLHDGGVYVALAALDPRSDPAVAVAAAVGLELRGTTSALSQLSAYLAERELLLVLDNAEHLDSIADLANQLLAAAPDLHILVTSREPLALQAEWLFDVGGLAYPTDATAALAAPTEYPALQLLLERAQRARADLVLNTEIAPALVQICALCEGMPLALELAAGQVRQLSVAAIAAAIQADLAVLTSSLRDLPPRQRSIRATIAVSLARLDPVDRHTYLQLACFVDGFSPAAAATVCGATEAQLERFVERSLLRRNDNGRYALHTLLRQFAAAEWQAQALEHAYSALSEQHAVYFLDLAGALAVRFPAAPQEASRALRPDLANLRRAWQHAVEHSALEPLAAGSAGLRAFYDLSGQFAEGEQLFGSAAHAAALHGGAAGARLLIGHALFLHRLSRYDQAARQAETALAIAQNQDLTELEIAARCRQGDSLHRLGRLTEAVATLTTALHLAQAADLPALECEALSYLGFIAREQSNYEAAQAAYSAALELAGTLGHTWERCRLLNHLGGVAEYQGRFAAAQAYFAEGLALAEALEARWLTGCIRGNLGNLDRNAGRYAAARAHYAAAQTMYREVGDPLGEEIVVFSDANVLADAGMFGAALERYAVAAHLAAACGDQLGRGLILLMQGRTLARMGDLPGGRTAATEGMHIVREQGARRFLALGLETLGRIAKLQSDPPAALAHYDAALAIYAELGEEHRYGEALIGVCECALLLADHHRAAQAFSALDQLLHAPGAETDALHRPPALYWRSATVARQLAPERVAPFQAAAQRLLELRAAAIGDDDLMRSFLNMPDHRIIRGENRDPAG